MYSYLYVFFFRIMTSEIVNMHFIKSLNIYYNQLFDIIIIMAGLYDKENTII